MSAIDGAASLIGGGYYSAALPQYVATTDYTVASGPPTPVPQVQAQSPTTQNAVLAYQQPVANAAATGGGGMAGTATPIAQVQAALKQCIDAINQITQILQANPQLLAASNDGGTVAGGGGNGSGMSTECAAMPCCAGMTDAASGAGEVTTLIPTGS